MYRYKPEGAKVYLETRLSKEEYYKDEIMVKQMENVCRLPFIFHHGFQCGDGITKVKHLEEATGAYKNIDDVMKRQEDLVKVKMKLRPLGVIKED